jgi:small-conductance mechanosensitive channel
VETQHSQQLELNGAPDSVAKAEQRRRRPWQAIIATLIAGAAAAAVHWLGVPLDLSPAQKAELSLTFLTPGTAQIITIAGAVVFCIASLVATFGFARWARAVLERPIGAAYGAILRYVMILTGICVIALTTLSMLNFPVRQLVVGGAVTGVLISIAAQQSLANLFAGVMLQFAHPFRVGDRVRVRSGALAGTIEGTVTEFSITYVRLDTDDGGVFLPNAQVLAAAVSPVRLTEPSVPGT